jgi:hypothetical protein
LSSYDRSRGLLIFFWTCEQCGTRLGEIGRLRYRPSFNPDGQRPARHAPREERWRPAFARSLAPKITALRVRRSG